MTGVQTCALPIFIFYQMSSSTGKLKSVRIGLGAHTLDNRDGLFGDSDPLFAIVKDGKELYRSEYLLDTSSPKWKSFELPLNKVGGHDGTFSIQIFDHDDKRDQLIGSTDVTIRELQDLLKSKSKSGLELQSNDKSGASKLFHTLFKKKNGFVLVHSIQKIFEEQVRQVEKKEDRKATVVDLIQKPEELDDDVANLNISIQDLHKDIIFIRRFAHLTVKASGRIADSEDFRQEMGKINNATNTKYNKICENLAEVLRLVQEVADDVNSKKTSDNVVQAISIMDLPQGDDYEAKALAISKASKQ